MTDIDHIVYLSNKIQNNGLASISDDINGCQDHFLKIGLQLIYDDVPIEKIRPLLNRNVNYIRQRHQQGIAFFETMSQYAPAFGLFGTVIGLIKLLADLGSPELFGQSMALAMVTTFYGLFFANFIFTPIAGRLKVLSDQESLQKEMLIIGLEGLANNESAYILKEELQLFLSNKERNKIWKT